MKLSFTKMQAIGNDFIIINQIETSYNLSADVIQKLADRHFGIGFDQLLIIENSQSTANDFKYRIFNADGSEVEHCGNGARCFYQYIKYKHLSNKEIILAETMKGTIRLSQEDDRVTVDMGSYQLTQTETNQLPSFDIFYQNKTILSTGIIVEQSPHFPNSINVGFCEIISDHQLKLIVYERGSGLTLGCGSGACAATVSAIHTKKIKDTEIEIRMPGGIIYSQLIANDHVLLKGDAEIVYEGTIIL
jgi:diaminopimelate epimerase